VVHAILDCFHEPSNFIKERDMRTTFFAAVLILIGCPIGHQCLASKIELKPLKVSGDFEGKDDKTAVDISGISCMPADGNMRTCLLVNDENKTAQFATFDDTKNELKVGQTVKLIGKNPGSETLGQSPEPTCGKNDGFKDLDGEGVAYAAPYFYVVGSHGCSRRKNEFHLSSFILARVGSNPADQVTTTYRVSDMLNKSDEVKNFFGKALDESGNGLNIEGIAAVGDTLWVGLRAPVTRDSSDPRAGDAYLVYGSISELFRAGHDTAVTTVHTMDIKLDKRGIRDLAPLPDGRMLVLAGPAQEQDVSYRMYIVDPKTKGNAELGTLESVSKDGTVGKAEGLTVLDATGNRAKFLVVFDGLKNGDPHLGEVELPH
jgi:hypothetical protein